MPTQVQFRRGSIATVAAFTGANGEIIVNSDTDTLHVQDGVAAGGFALQKAQKTARLDFGANPVYTLTGTISDAYAIANSTYQSMISIYPSSANALANGASTTTYSGDEQEFDTFHCSAYVSTNGTISYQVTAVPGPVANTRIFNYIIS